MNSDTRIAEIVTALELTGFQCLVMGGHAVRFYGLSRNTIDLDLHVAPDCWQSLPARLAAAPIIGDFHLSEGPSWRPQSFRRFQIGRLPDGREEWLEFWSGNHLLAPFADLYARREQGLYGGRLLSFLSLPDLIRSKETERAVDCQDIAFLEEFLDARMLSRAESGEQARSATLGCIRSRTGFESALQKGFFSDVSVVEQALAAAGLAITQAYLLPFAPAVVNRPVTTPAIEPVIESRLKIVSPASPLHLTLVEAVRRQYRLTTQAEVRHPLGSGEQPTFPRSPGARLALDAQSGLKAAKEEVFE